MKTVTTLVLLAAFILPATAQKTQKPDPATELRCMDTTSDQLAASFSSYLKKAKKYRLTKEESELNMSLVELTADIDHLIKTCRSGESARHIYRDFNSVEYSLADAKACCVAAGYYKMFKPQFDDLEYHADTLTKLGFRNPRLDAHIEVAPAHMKAPKAQPVAENPPPNQGNKPSGSGGQKPGHDHDHEHDGGHGGENGRGEMTLGDLLQKVFGR